MELIEQAFGNKCIVIRCSGDIEICDLPTSVDGYYKLIGRGCKMVEVYNNIGPDGKPSYLCAWLDEDGKLDGRQPVNLHAGIFMLLHDLLMPDPGNDMLRGDIVITARKTDADGNTRGLCQHLCQTMQNAYYAMTGRGLGSYPMDLEQAPLFPAFMSFFASAISTTAKLLRQAEEEAAKNSKPKVVIASSREELPEDIRKELPEELLTMIFGEEKRAGKDAAGATKGCPCPACKSIRTKAN